jgi:hypothetical protein
VELLKLAGIPSQLSEVFVKPLEQGRTIASRRHRPLADADGTAAAALARVHAATGEVVRANIRAQNSSRADDDE